MTEPTLDFSEFHPLDHWVGQKRCREHFGGIRNHLSLWHDYQAPDPLGRVMCLFGRHHWVKWRQGKLSDIEAGVAPVVWEACTRCHDPKP